jgi:hypothetical protein
MELYEAMGTALSAICRRLMAVVVRLARVGVWRSGEICLFVAAAAACGGAASESTAVPAPPKGPRADEPRPAFGAEDRSAGSAVASMSSTASGGEWHLATVRSRTNAEILLLDNGEVAAVSLRDVAVFDCRRDCFVDIREMLAPVGPSDQVCVATADGSKRVFKLWVDRAHCGPY